MTARRRGPRQRRPMPHLPARFAAVSCLRAVVRPPLLAVRPRARVGAILAPGRLTVTSLCDHGPRAERHFVTTTGCSAARRGARVPERGSCSASPSSPSLPSGRWCWRLTTRSSAAAAGRIAAQRHLPRPGALVRLRLRQNERPALDEPDAAGRRSLGRAGPGSAVPHRPRSLRALPAARQGRRDMSLLDVGRQTRLSGASLAERPRPRAGRRQRLLARSLFLDALRGAGVTAITRLRLDAALYEPAPPRLPGTIGAAPHQRCAAVHPV